MVCLVVAMRRSVEACSAPVFFSDDVGVLELAKTFIGQTFICKNRYIFLRKLIYNLFSIQVCLIDEVRFDLLPSCLFDLCFSGFAWLVICSSYV